MNNVKFSYLYRDAGNYKKYSSVVFMGDNNININHIEKLINAKLVDQLWFYASQWQIPDLHFTQWDDELDHTFHEFECIEYTNEAPNTLLTLAKFKALIEETNCS